MKRWEIYGVLIWEMVCIIWVNGVLSRNGIDRTETNGNGFVFVS